MDLTHGNVLLGGRELLSDVPMYINADSEFVHWGGCLHLQRDYGSVLDSCDLEKSECTIRLRDGRLGNIRIRKIISTNGSLHIEVLFEGAGPLSKAG